MCILLKMASQVVSRDLHILEIRSYVRGYHAYMEVWTPALGQILLVKRVPNNNKEDRNSVGVFLEEAIMGQVPYNLALTVVSVFNEGC